METKQYKHTYVKFSTNIPEHVTFKFDTPREYDGKFGKQYNYGVSYKGVDAIMSVTETLNNMLQQIGSLSGKQLQILKYEDGNKKMWKIMDAMGNDITPSYAPPQNNPTPTLSDRTNAQREWALQVVADIKKLRNEVDEMREELDGLVGALITPENEKAYELHKATTKPLRDALTAPVNNPLPDEYADVPTVDAE